MKRLICILMILVIGLCGCAQQPSDTGEGESTLPTSPPVIVPIGERTEEGVKVTIHSGLLGMNSEYLSEEQKADGFLSGVRNEDDSVTYTIANDKYEAFVEKSRQNALKSIDETVRGNFGSVTNVECEPDLSAVKLTVRRVDYEYSVDAIVVFAVGSLAVIHQAYDVDAPGTCVITVVDEDGKQVSRNVYPDELVI